MSSGEATGKARDRVFLVGPMGAGKSTIGRRLARTLGFAFVDSDQELEERTGVDIPRIFDVEGEAGFRRREEIMIDELSRRHGIVLATGGGAVLSALTRERLSARGVVVYLETSVEEQFRRTGRDRNRPLLQTDDPKARLASLMVEREPLYRQVSDVVVSTDSGAIGAVIHRIAKALEKGKDTH